jgi:hypothetical protein
MTKNTQAKAKAPTTNLLEAAQQRAAENAERIKRKTAAFDRLAEAQGIFATAGQTSEKGKALVDEATAILYQDLAAGSVGRAEVQAKLVDLYGARPKKDGSPGKTPVGIGEDIRKRINRAAEVAIFVNNPNDERLPSYFQPFPEGSLDKLAAQFAAGEIGSFRLWNAVADLRRELSDGPVPLALNATRIVDMAEAIETNRSAIAADETLRVAYTILQEAMLTVQWTEGEAENEGEDEGQSVPVTADETEEAEAA